MTMPPSSAPQPLDQCLIISGRSGSGKSTALQALEDLGYYCVDNMPLRLLPDLINQLQQDGALHNLAVGIDARNLSTQLEHFQQVLSDIKATGQALRVLYLDANDSILLQRFGATRRRHPLSDDTLSLPAAIKHEAHLLADIRAAADIIIDTSALDIHRLRNHIRSQVDSCGNQLTVQVMSFAFKHGVPRDADLLFDVRVLPNPYWEEGLRELTGHDDAVVDFLSNKADSQKMLNDILGFIDHWLPAYQANDRSYLTIAIGCTGGRHRSVYIANQLAAQLQAQLPDLQLRHRDCPPEDKTA